MGSIGKVSGLLRYCAAIRSGSGSQLRYRLILGLRQSTLMPILSVPPYSKNCRVLYPKCFGIFAKLAASGKTTERNAVSDITSEYTEEIKRKAIL